MYIFNTFFDQNQLSTKFKNLNFSWKVQLGGFKYKWFSLSRGKVRQNSKVKVSLYLLDQNKTKLKKKNKKQNSNQNYTRILYDNHWLIWRILKLDCICNNHKTVISVLQKHAISVWTSIWTLKAHEATNWPNASWCV